MKIKNILLCGILSLISLGAMAQNITGTITDATTGDALIGATVHWEGTTVGVICEADGTYSIHRVKGNARNVGNGLPRVF